MIFKHVVDEDKRFKNLNFIAIFFPNLQRRRRPAKVPEGPWQISCSGQQSRHRSRLMHWTIAAANVGYWYTRPLSVRPSSFYIVLDYQRFPLHAQFQLRLQRAAPAMWLAVTVDRLCFSSSNTNHPCAGPTQSRRPWQERCYCNTSSYYLVGTLYL